MKTSKDEIDRFFAAHHECEAFMERLDEFCTKLAGELAYDYASSVTIDETKRQVTFVGGNNTGSGPWFDVNTPIVFGLDTLELDPSLLIVACRRAKQEKEEAFRAEKERGEKQRRYEQYLRLCEEFAPDKGPKQ